MRDLAVKIRIVFQSSCGKKFHNMKPLYMIFISVFCAVILTYASIIGVALGTDEIFNPASILYFPGVVIQLVENKGNGIVCVDACGPCSSYGSLYVMRDGKCVLPENATQELETVTIDKKSISVSDNNKDIIAIDKPITEKGQIPVKITGDTAFQICSIIGVPCPPNPTFEALHNSDTNLTTFDVNVGMHIYDFTLSRTKICYTLDGLSDNYCQSLAISHPELDGNKPLLLSKDVREWQDMSEKKLHEYYKSYGDDFYIELGRFMIKNEILNEIDRKNIMIENYGEHILVQVSMVNQSLPPDVYYYADVNSTDGKSYRFNGATHSNEIFEFSSKLKENET